MDRTFSYRKKLLLWIMPTIIIGLLSLGAGAYWFINNVIEENLTNSMLEMTGKTAEGISTWCKTLVVEPEIIAATPEAKLINTNFNLIDSQNITRYKTLHKKYPDVFLDIYAANREGIYHTVTHQDGEYSMFVGDISSREYFKHVMRTGNSHITPPLVSRTTGIPTIFVVAPILDDRDHPQGLVGTGISLEHVQKIAAGLKAGKSGYGIVIAQDGTFIYHPNEEYMMKQKITNLQDPTVVELGFLMLSGNSGIYHYVLDGKKKVAFYQPVPFTGWSVATTIPEDEFLAPVNEMVKSLTITTIIILLIIGSTIWLVTRRLSKPLQELASHAQQISAGNLLVEPVKVASGDEIGILAKNFNRMTETLRSMMGELALKNQSLENEVQERKQAENALQQANDNLEYRVVEKTKELSTANEELTAMNEEMLAMNEELEDTNKRLQSEVHVRLQMEEELLLRERQYRATTNLLTRPIDQVENYLNVILQNALQLIKAPYGYIGLYSEDSEIFNIHHSHGIDQYGIMVQMTGVAGLHNNVLHSGEPLFIEDYNLHCQSTSFRDDIKAISLALLPLKQGEKVKGILAAFWCEQQHQASTEDMEILRQFGDLASVAMERSSIHEKSQYMAFHDDLTGLPNRANLTSYLEKEMKKASSGEVNGIILFIDVDDLKSINDNFGHSSGDIIIKRAGDDLQAALGKEAFIARLGGDEFIAVISGVGNREAATEIANIAISSLSQEYEIANQKLHMSASVGVVLYPNDGNIVEDLLKKADSAMYAAKKAGRNCWRFYDPALSDEAYEKITLTNGLRHALKHKEFFLQYQPQFTLDGSSIIGFEALLRWQSPEYGLVSPFRFIPLAEQSGLIVPIGQWVLVEACRFARKLSEMGKSDLRVAVNISPKQLLTDDFVDNVCATVTHEAISPRQITIEVTESILIESTDSIRKLQQLRDFGFTLALDDFGTGYSSLTYLKSLPVNILKIDKSFIDRDSLNDAQLHVVGSIVTLGRALGLTIVAEGVETVSQLEILKQHQCDGIQGYIFGRPVSEIDALSLLIK